jgi:hypothetical protein
MPDHTPAERYPLTTLYYRELIGCPEDKDIICVTVGKARHVRSCRLDTILSSVFETYPTLGPIVINDQSAEEAFTFYDHPKAMVFRKNENFDIRQVQALLSTSDPSKALG